MPRLVVSLADARAMLAEKHNLNCADVEIEGSYSNSNNLNNLTGEEVKVQLDHLMTAIARGAGHKITAIKAYRTLTGACLYDAKMAVEDASVPF